MRLIKASQPMERLSIDFKGPLRLPPAKITICLRLSMNILDSHLHFHVTESQTVSYFVFDANISFVWCLWLRSFR